MADINYDLKLSNPELFLLKPNGYKKNGNTIVQDNITIGKLTEAYHIRRSIQLNNISKLEFKLPYFIEFNHKIIDNPHIEHIKEKYVIKAICDGKEEFYLIDSYMNDMTEENDYKLVKCLSLQIELKETYLQDFNVKKAEGFTIREILQGKTNAEGTTERNGLLKKTNWTIGHIDAAFAMTNDTGLPFVIRGTSTVLNAILSMAQMYKCTIIWDTKNRKINIYEPQNIGSDKGLHFSYGHYLKTLSNEFNMDKMITRLYVYGKDGLSIEEVSPLGQNYIEDYTYYMFPFERDEYTKEVIKHSYYMTDELCHALLDYKQLIDSKKDELKQKTEDLRSESNILIQLEVDMYHAEQELIRKQDQHYIYYSVRNNVDEFNNTGRPYTQEEYDRFTEEMGGDDLWQEVVNARNIYEQKVQLVKSQKTIIESKKQFVLELRNLLSEENNFSLELLKEKIHFTREREFTDSNQINPNKLYERGLKEFQALQFPEKTFKIDVVNFLDCIEEQRNWSKLNLSDIITIKNETLKVNSKARLIEVLFDYETGNLELTISITDDLEDELTELADLINKLVSTSIQVEATIPVWEELQIKSDYISTIIDKFYDNVADQINLAVNQSVTIDEYGITIYEMLDENTKDEMNFLRITNGALGITNDSGKTYKNAITSQGIIGERIIGKLIMGHNLVLGDPDGMLEILGNKGIVRDRCLDPRPDTNTYLRGREVMRFGLYNYDINNVDDYRNPHPTDISQDKFGIQLFGNFSEVLTVNNNPPIMGNLTGIPQNYNAQPLSRVTMDSQDGFYIDKWENRGEGYDWHKKFYVDGEGALFAEDMTGYRLKILQKPNVLLIDAENRFMNIGRISEMVLDGALTPLEKIQVRTEWARIEKEFIELQKAYLEHRYTYRGGDEYGNKSNMDHLDNPNSPAWKGTEFAKHTTGFWTKFKQAYSQLNKYLNVDIITFPNIDGYPHGSLLSDARKHITERENDISDNGETLEFDTGFSRSNFLETFTDYYNATKVLIDAINTLIRWSSTELGRFYNDVRIDAEDGIVVTRSDNKNQVWLSATDGFSIAKNKNSLPFTYYPFLEYSKTGAEINGSRSMQNWQKVFYVDTDGNLNMLGSLDMLSLDDQTRVLIDQNSPDGIPFSIMGRSRSIGMSGGIRPNEKYSDHTGEWWRKLYIDTNGNLFANDLTANRLILRDINGDVVIDANSGFLDLNKLNILGNIMADNIVTGTIIADVGHVADLTVNRLKSLDINKEGKTANYVDIQEQYVKWITATLQSTGVQRQQMALNEDTGTLEMMPLYWTNSNRISTTTYPEDFPNAEPVYEQRIVNPVVKMEISFDGDDPNHIPRIILGNGVGDGSRKVKGYIFKDFVSPTNQGLMIQYFDVQDRNRTIRMDDEGISLFVGGNKITVKDDSYLKLEHTSGSFIGFHGSDININAAGKVNINGTQIHLNA